MFGLFDKLNDPENAHRERAAFLVAIVLIAAIGGAWFYFLRPTESAPPTPVGAASGAEATSTAEVSDLNGPISNFRAEMADGAIFLAGQVRKISNLWKEWSFGKPVEYEQQATTSEVYIP